jgi:tetratricopeptide (TPR) repeat protein
MSAEAQRALGDACLVRGEWKRAFTAFQKALYLNPDVTAAQEGLKEAHEQLRLLGELPAEHETRAPEVAAPEAPDDVDLDGEEEDESVEPTEWLDEGEQGDLAADDWDELPEAEAVEDDEADGSVESLVDLNGLEDDESEEAAAATLQDEEADSRPVDGAAFAPEGVEAEGGVPQIEPVEEEDAATELEPVEEESAAAEAFAEEPDETPEEIPVEEFDAEPVAASLEDSGVEEEAVAEEDAAEPAETAVEADAGDEASLEDLLRLGAACYQEERFEEALEAWREASRLDPAHPAALNNQAAALLAMGDAEQARNFCERAVYLDPSYGVARATLCEVLVELDRFDEARAEAEKLRRYNCDLADQVLAYLDEEIQLRGNRSGEGEGESNGKYTPVNGAQHLH